MSTAPICPRLPIVFACLGFAVLPLIGLRAAVAPAWVEASNAHAQVLIDALAQFQPEQFSGNGMKQFDKLTFDYGPGVNQRFSAALAGARDELARQLAAEHEPNVRQDIEILIHQCNMQIESTRISDANFVPFIDVGSIIYGSMLQLLQDEVAPARRSAALDRLRRYAGFATGTTALTRLARDRYLEAPRDKSHLQPYKGEVEQLLANADSYANGIKELFKKYDIKDASEVVTALEKQLGDYTSWVRTTVLPVARDDFRIPLEVYADNLRQIGTDIPPSDLIRNATASFGEIRKEMETLAPLIAHQRGWSETDYKSVFRRLKSEQLTAAETEKYYLDVIKSVQEIIKREHIATLPQREMTLRIASEAEAASLPAPHFQQPPLVGNTGERGVFVLPLANPSTDGKASDRFDDFSYKATTWTLTAHEGRPGHDLQFTSMVDRGVSLARAMFAFNSVNVEGWALYAEVEMKPYEPLEAQFATLQWRLLRAARAFLDPMLNLGLIGKTRAEEILENDVGLSKAMMRQEIDRYTFVAPGQATAYFYGYTRLMSLRTKTEIALGSKFDRQAFNDFILDQGLLPLDLIENAVETEFIPARLKL